jgi:hypothetical protein
MDNPTDIWMEDFDPRQQKQIKWAQAYDTDEFRHGDNGHNDKLIIAKMAAKLTHYEGLLNDHGIPLDLTPGAEDHA